MEMTSLMPSRSAAPLLPPSVDLIKTSGHGRIVLKGGWGNLHMCRRANLGGASQEPPGRFKLSALAAALKAEAPTLDLPAGDANNVIPAGFVFPESSRATLAHDVFDFDLPVIDLGVFAKLDALRQKASGVSTPEIVECELEADKVRQQLRDACEEYGFFQIVNHGFPMTLVNNLRDIAYAFFNKPLEEKQKASNPKRLTGYISGLPTSSDKKGNRLWRETFGVRMVLGRAAEDSGTWHLAQHLAREPGEAAGVSAAVQRYVRTMEDVALQVLELLAESFELPGQTFSEHFREKPDRTCLFHINHYPPCPQPDLALGTHRHTDPFAINIVHQDHVGGLQVLTADGAWHGVKPIPGAFVVNVGDLLQMWSNDRLLSAEHRVVGNRDQSRMSFCFFYNPSKQARIDPPAELVDAQHPRRYRSFRTVEFSDVVTSHGAGRRGVIVEKFGLNSKDQ